MDPKIRAIGWLPSIFLTLVCVIAVLAVNSCAWESGPPHVIARRVCALSPVYDSTIKNLNVVLLEKSTLVCKDGQRYTDASALSTSDKATVYNMVAKGVPVNIQVTLSERTKNEDRPDVGLELIQ